MTIRHKVAVVALVASTFSWIMWIDDIRAGGVCDSPDWGCKRPVSVPCSGSSVCAALDSSSDLTTRRCNSGTSAGFFIGTPPLSWEDCGGGTSKNNPCEQKAAVCLTATLYATEADCKNKKSCRTTEVERCRFKSGDTECSKM